MEIKGSKFSARKTGIALAVLASVCASAFNNAAAAEPGAASSIETYLQLHKAPLPDGQTRLSVILGADDYKAYRSDRGGLSFFKEFFQGFNYDLKEELETHLSENGFSPKAAKTTSQYLAKTYHPSQGYDENAENPIYETHPLLGKKRQTGAAATYVSADGTLLDPQDDDLGRKQESFCLVFHTTNRHTGAQWTASFLRGAQDITPADFNMPREFGAEFAAFVKNHELAHCGGANEARADMVAALLLLKEHPDTDQAKAFLRHIADLRRISLVVNPAVRAKYQGTADAIEKALHQAETGLLDGLSADDIRRQAHIPLVFDMKEDLRLQAALSSKDLKELASIVRDRNFQQAHGEAARKLSQSLDAMIIKIEKPVTAAAPSSKPPMPSPGGA